MRTFETIGSGKKLITTNADIKDYPFYNPEIYLLLIVIFSNGYAQFFNNQ